MGLRLPVANLRWSLPPTISNNSLHHINTMSTSSSLSSSKKAKTYKKTGDKMNKFLKAAASSVDAMKADMAKHNADMATMKADQEKMKEQIKQMQRIVVDKLGTNNENKRTADGEKKLQRKKIEHINNYYVVATEFFNTLCSLIGKEKMKALGKDGINAWGANKDELKSWFIANGLDLEKKLKMEEIRSIIEEKKLVEAFTAKFSELSTSIKGLTAKKGEVEEEVEEEVDEEEEGEDSASGEEEDDE